MPVLLGEVVAALAPCADSTYVDCTAGLGGHAAEIASRMGAGQVVLIDADPTMLARAEARVREAAPGCTVVARRGNFAEAERLVDALGLKADMVLADLGFCSAQMDEGERGFSFMRDGPLDMRLDPGLSTSAADLVNTLPERELASIFRDFGEEPRASQVARKIVGARSESPILTTVRLAELIRAIVPRSPAGIDPATRVFQALRIAVNDELGALERALPAAVEMLRPGGRLAAISFHSLEDRIVKSFLRRKASMDPVWAGLPQVPAHALPAMRLVGRKIRPSAAEVAANPRARSAVLRVAEKIAEQGGAPA